MIHNNIEEIIGNTPLLKISSASHGLRHTDVYVKLEYLNPFGSIKDRTALGLTKNIDFKELNKRGARLIESSSGNTAKALQLIAGRQGNGLVSVTNRVKIPEVDQMLRYIGVDIVPLPGRSECPDPNDSDGALGVIEKMKQANPDSYVHTDQYSNLANPEIHEQTTAKEIYNDLDVVDYVVMGVGTGGSSGGLVSYIRKNNLTTKAIGVVADSSDFLPGIRTETELYETELFHKEWFEDLVEVTTQDALVALEELIQNDGVLAGPTTGASFAAVKRYLKSRDTPRADGSRQVAVFVACDRLETYMSYITKRLPERFNLTTHTDVFTLNYATDEKDKLEKNAGPEVAQWLLDHKVTVIDTRGVKPFEAFHIEGSLNYPEELLREISEQGTPFSDTSPVLFVCPRGDRSLLYASLFRKRGVEAYSLAGGLLAWRSAGLELARPSHG